MPYEKCTLPEYPATSDMWLELKKLNKPIVVYGMGNGADKLFSRLERYGVTPSDIFASDGFVRAMRYTFARSRTKRNTLSPLKRPRNPLRAVTAAATTVLS